MRPSLVLQKRKKRILEIISGFPVTNPRVFGSIASGSDIEGSDIDILIDALPDATYFDLAGLKLNLEQELGVRIDIVTPDALPELIRDEIICNAIKICG